MRRQTVAITLVLALFGSALVAAAQFRRGGYARADLGVLPPERTGFTFCRLFYTSVRGEAGGMGWDTDYPGADQNLTYRLPEFTHTRVTTYPDGSPHHAVVRATDPTLFECPFLFASDVGTVAFSQDEMDQLRTYFEKGGFLWVDDFWGSAAWTNWSREITRVLPEYPIVELQPGHPIFSTFYTIDKVPQIPSIQHWRSSGGGTSERGADSAVARMYGIFDAEGRLLVLMSHNTDIADGWEREGEDWAFFHAFSPHGYAVGVNVAIWALTH